ncbi:MAG TPA: MmgE/PrpD family protein [Thermohalobaculum sp.]|nr:MmgE/PrpD family protein [Thermohalobaculum sp.]
MTLTAASSAQALASFAAGQSWAEIPAPVRHQARRALVNIFATAIAGCREPAVEIALGVMAPFAGPATCSLIGRGERRDAALAAFVNAMAANIHDFDDTHPETIIHPTAPVAPALLALAEIRPCSGADLLRAFLIGAETACRIGNAVAPSHYARGWHITSTCGAFGASAGAAALLGLDARQTVWALANASVQAAGLVETLGTMSKSISVGNAARNGLLSALLAERGFEGPPGALDAFLRLTSDAPRPDALTGRLGTEWTFATNTCKPYPVGVVLNPVIDASLQIAAASGFRAAEVEAVHLAGHPLLGARADRPDVVTGRESQVSAQHAIAIVWRRGRAGLDEFDDAAVAETLAAGRPRVEFTDEPSRDPASVHMTVRMRGGGVFEAEIAAARGTLANPLSDRELEQKLTGLAARAGFTGDAEALARAVWGLEDAPDAGALARLAAG